MDTCNFMMTSWNGNIFRVTGPLWEESTGHRWIPLTKASDAELWCFQWSAPEYTVEQAIKWPIIWHGIVFIMTSLWCVTFHLICLYIHNSKNYSLMMKYSRLPDITTLRMRSDHNPSITPENLHRHLTHMPRISQEHVGRWRQRVHKIITEPMKAG